MSAQPQMVQSDNASIVLATINARYIHSAFGLRYLKANLQELESQCRILEFTLENKPEDIAEQLLAGEPKIIGLSVYVWNAQLSLRVAQILKSVAPHITLILGGPEVSYEYDTQDIVELSDYLITGWGEVSFRELCRDLLAGSVAPDKVIAGKQAKLNELVLPYHLYTEEDLAHRILYVEASRGCPFKCEFCLSALDKTAWSFDIDHFLSAMEVLYQRGARHFKFVDRTFNLKVATSIKIMQFFLDRLDEGLFLHFEVIPDHLPDALKAQIQAFPAGSLQFEIGIQSFDEHVQTLISRRQNNQRARENLHWIRSQTQAHIHADLIFGLPGQDLNSFAGSFDALYALRPHEIQVGILKRLKGSPIIRHTQDYELVFNQHEPFNVLKTDRIDYQTLQAINRFARYWDLIANSGRFSHTLPLLLAQQPFARFYRLSQCLYEKTGRTHKIALLRLFDAVFDSAMVLFDIPKDLLLECIHKDFLKSGLKSQPHCLRGMTSDNLMLNHDYAKKQRKNRRQIRHQG